MKDRKVWQVFSSVSILSILILSVVACESRILHTLFKEQEWSENYALADGVTCTSPKMIDGDLETAGPITNSDIMRSRFKQRLNFSPPINGSGSSGVYKENETPSAEVEIDLPERKSIHKIIIHSKELNTFSILAYMGESDGWQVIKTISKVNHTDDIFVIRTSVITDRIMIRTKGRLFQVGSEESGRKFLFTGRPVETKLLKVMGAKIQEIELYGLKR